MKFKKRPLGKCLKIKQAVKIKDKKLFEPPLGGEFFLSVAGVCVVFYKHCPKSLEFFVLFFQEKSTRKNQEKME